MGLSDRFRCVAVLIVEWIDSVPEISIRFGLYREYCCMAWVEADLRRRGCGCDTLCVPRSDISGKASCSTTTSLRQTAVGNIESRLIDEFTPAATSSDLQNSVLGREYGRPTDRGAAEVPSRSPTEISGRKEVWMVPDGHAALQGLSSIPHLTSVAAGFYRNDVINGSKTSAGQTRAMMSEFAVAPTG
ncbi:hypothetical protein THAOC_27974 [Thalassiosira oceanica]|uniref:Uncharacterized protein n=1 Tax=Thalassiosira oceanica TaxID=159749 RepID=K0RHM0_THAOC|nr:hypothetical protein THAOC_27974 [Thalassiosira oceanica]|eukprot:EJK52720.1 hypothetical protein THAOC_27974 [Thalassiosira oceanica]